MTLELCILHEHEYKNKLKSSFSLSKYRTFRNSTISILLIQYLSHSRTALMHNLLRKHFFLRISRLGRAILLSQSIVFFSFSIAFLYSATFAEVEEHWPSLLKNNNNKEITGECLIFRVIIVLGTWLICFYSWPYCLLSNIFYIHISLLS